ncbi:MULTISPECIES: 30S ribosomal protein S4 [unclassified Candidatus Cardinium]|uniref:30S ribosomal protein S4 n=1 Tax=unclassified Candidatus Cardinium TaxID=2641185 RepID=UPI001FB1EC4B|nr:MULTISPECIES: 30S ribosomal protein S4 [unclassified Candidatus Cardinium]
MARYRGPKAKVARRYNSPIFGSSVHKVLQKKNYPPGQHGRRRKRRSQFGLQLVEQQKAKYTYGLLQRQFKNLCEKAAKSKGITGEVILQRLEARLDNTVYRLGIATTRREARQIVSHRHSMVNGKVVDIPSYTLKPGDIITVTEKAKNMALIVNNVGSNPSNKYSWLEWDASSMVGKFLAFPQRSEIPEEINERSIVELHSK